MNRWMKIGFLVAVVGSAAGLVFVGLVPWHPSSPCSPNTFPSGASGTDCQSGSRYAYMSEPLPAYGTNASFPMKVAFANVSFSLWYAPWPPSAGGLVISATGVESNGTAWSLNVSDHSPPGGWDTDISADGVFGLQWSTGGTSVYLIVRQ